MAVQIGMHGFHSGPPSFPPPQFIPSIPVLTPVAMETVPPQNLQSTSTAGSSVPTTTPSTTSVAATPAAGTTAGANYDGRRMRSKTSLRKTVDYNASIVNWIHNRTFQRDHRDMRVIQPESIYNHTMVPPAMLLDMPVNTLTTRSVRMALNKVKCPIFTTRWTPEGRRLVTGASSGEFTLWHGLTFSFETILQAHDLAVRAMVWSNNDQWMLTADHGGFVKYWQSNMNNVKMYQAHKEPVRGLRWATKETFLDSIFSIFLSIEILVTFQLVVLIIVIIIIMF